MSVSCPALPDVMSGRAGQETDILEQSLSPIVCGMSSLKLPAARYRQGDVTYSLQFQLSILQRAVSTNNALLQVYWHSVAAGVF